MKTKTATFNKSEIKELLKEKNLLEFNREILPKHVASMADSINSCGILRLPILGDISAFDKRKISIIDGQHLLSAWVKTSSYKIECIVKKYDDKSQVIKDVATLNNIQKTWTDENYLNAWYKFGKDNIDHFTNYSYLWNMYNDVYDGLPCGFLVDLYANNKDGFRTGELEFRDRSFSDKVAYIAHILKEDYNKSSFTLHGLRLWCFERKFQHQKSIDFEKLKSRIKLAFKNREDQNCNGREDFKDFIDRIYKRL